MNQTSAENNDDIHLIAGMAGHIDHGKTAIIKALTDIDCDTHPEERLRGITINLGFAHLNLRDGLSIGIVDVPGHRDFINNMIAGASGIDFVIMVIAADSGVMPQSVEHLKIMEILGVRNGLVVLTKIDLVEEDLLLIAEQEVTDFLKGTFLENKSILKVSVKTGEGIEKLKQKILEIASEVKPKEQGEIFRMFIDRIFTVKGFGTVVTGSVLSGSIIKGQNVFLIPREKELRVRRLERHGNEVERIKSGDRCSINLVGLNRTDFERGMIISDRLLPPTQLLDAKLLLFGESRNFDIWSQVNFLVGTYQSQARIHLIDKNRLECGESALVQIHLNEPCMAQLGDKFVIRNSSDDLTLGGGTVIDAYPLHHRRRPKKLISELQKVTEGGFSEKIGCEVRKRLFPLTFEYIANLLNISQDKVSEISSISLPEDIMAISFEGNSILLLKYRMMRLKDKILKNLENFHKRYPLYEGGRTFEELTGLFGVYRSSTNEIILKYLLNWMMEEGIIEKINNTLKLSSHRVTLSKEDEKQIQLVENYHKNSGMKTPLMSELISWGDRLGIHENKLKQILHLLTAQEKIYNIDGNFVFYKVIDESRILLLEYLLGHDEGISVAGFRDLVHGNRKICLLMLTQFDREGVIIREGNNRFITSLGKDKLNQLLLI